LSAPSLLICLKLASRRSSSTAKGMALNGSFERDKRSESKRIVLFQNRAVAARPLRAYIDMDILHVRT
jgi:hypothetical protein